MLKGSCVAIVTPFRDGNIDYEALNSLINWHIEEGTDCIVPCGCTGEAATLSEDEHKKLIDKTVEMVEGRVKVMPGTGSNSTSEAIHLTSYARDAGADAALIITPYYNKPTQEGLYRHYEELARETDIPLCLYNVPSRTGVNMMPQTVARLAEIESISMIKEASGSVAQCAELIRLCGDKITLLSGDDSITFPLMAMGGKGVVSVVANIVPGAMSRMTKLFSEGENEKAREIHYKWLPMMDALFIETNPGPVKEALGMMGKIKPELRLPLVNMSSENREKLKKVMSSFSLGQKNG
ncbi:MAG: 4-hydroxy-tetrahydrodipicolinate synthase [Elusimicrobiota bacterium]